MQQLYVTTGSVISYIHLMEMVYDITSHPKRKDIEQRIKMIKSFDDYGADATGKAFGTSRSIIYLWKQKL